MAVDVSRTQDVYKDAGQSVNFTTLLLNRKDRDAELEVIQDMADRIQAIKRSVSIRANGEGLGIAFGFSRKAWDYLFPNAPVPKELEDFQGIKDDKPICTLRHNEFVSCNKPCNHTSNHKIRHNFEITMFTSLRYKANRCIRSRR